jgi:hypothetical protein
MGIAKILKFREFSLETRQNTLETRQNRQNFACFGPKRAKKFVGLRRIY